MPVFTSDRERHLWLWTLGTMVAIYSTLGPARVLVDALRERNLLRASLAVALVLVVVVVLRQWLRRRPGRGEVGVALGVAFAYGVSFIRIETPEERTHLVEYGVVAALVHQALLERIRHGGTVRAPAALAVGITAVLGFIDEGIQAFIPGRFYDIRDVGFNALAGAMVIVARLALEPVRRVGWRFWFLWLMAGTFGWGWGMELVLYGGRGGVESLQSRPDVILMGCLGVAAGGLLTSVFQWLVLRGEIRGAGRWISASLVAVGVFCAIVFGVGALDPELGWVVGAGLFGPLLALFQGLVLRGQVSGLTWWVGACTLAWVAGMPIGDSIAWPALGAVYGAISGAVLVWLLRRGIRP